MSLSTQELATLQSAVTQLVVTSGDALVSVWDHIGTVRLKDIRDPVTTFDGETEMVLRAELAKLLPEAGFAVEEGQNTEVREYMWVIDPIDQTKNFVGHIPLFYTQVALMQGDDPLLGVIYNPVSKQLFSAHKGGGTTLNGVPHHAIVHSTLADSLLDIDLGGSKDVEWKQRVVSALMARAYRVRMTGGAYHPYLGSGFVDGVLVLDQQTKLVDHAPRMAIARELGLVYEKRLIGTRTVYVAGNGALCTELDAVLRTSA